MEERIRDDWGLAVHPDWLQACLAHLGRANPGFARKPQPQQLACVLDQLLVTDLRCCSAGGCLPALQVCVWGGAWACPSIRVAC
jgi:hypothetical protein